MHVAGCLCLQTLLTQTAMFVSLQQRMLAAGTPTVKHSSSTSSSSIPYTMQESVMPSSLQVHATCMPEPCSRVAELQMLSCCACQAHVQQHSASPPQEHCAAYDVAQLRCTHITNSVASADLYAFVLAKLSAQRVPMLSLATAAGMFSCKQTATQHS
jgi:hypothetical protein